MPLRVDLRDGLVAVCSSLYPILARVGFARPAGLGPPPSLRRRGRTARRLPTRSRGASASTLVASRSSSARSVGGSVRNPARPTERSIALAAAVADRLSAL